MRTSIPLIIFFLCNFGSQLGFSQAPKPPQVLQLPAPPNSKLISYQPALEPYPYNDTESIATHMISENGVSEYFRYPTLRAYYEAALPRLQLLNIAHSQLENLIEAYLEDPKTEKPKEISELLAVFQRSDFDKSFTLAKEDKFVLDGIKEPRLAINNGYHIFFNVFGIKKLKSFSFDQAVGLYLHELFHFQQNVPLATRDQIVGDIANWVRSHTTELQISPTKKMIVVTLPPKDHYKFEKVSNYYQREIRLKTLKDQLIVISDDETKCIETDMIQKFIISFDSQNHSNYDPYTQNPISIPGIKVNSIRLNAAKAISISFRKTERNLQLTGDFLEVDRASTEYESQPRVSQDYNLEYDPKDKSLGISKSYSYPLEAFDFEINKYVENLNGRFLSIRVRNSDTQTANLLSPDKPVFLKAKHGTETLMFKSLGIKKINSTDALVHFKIGPGSLHLSQILIYDAEPKTNKYLEKLILPSQDLRVSAAPKPQIQASPTQATELKLDISDWKRPSALLKYKGSKEISGITLEMQHYMEIYKNRYEYETREIGWVKMPTIRKRPSSPRELVTNFALGKKYFIPVRQIRSKIVAEETSLRFTIPLEKIQDYKEGDFYFVDYPRESNQSIMNHSSEETVDSLSRNIETITVHFKDGTIMPISASEVLPNFTLKEDSELSLRPFSCSRIFSR